MTATESAEQPALTEFSFLESDAELVGFSGELPKVVRSNYQTSQGNVSALEWSWPGQSSEGGLVLLHGSALNAHTWDATILAAKKNAIAFDLPGHGDSDWRADFDYSPQTNSKALAEVLAKQQLKDQVLVGQSLGGLTAIILAALLPEVFSRLVLVDVVPFKIAELKAIAQQVSGFLSGPIEFESRKELVDRALEFGFGPSREAVEKGIFLNTKIRDDNKVVYKHHIGNVPGGFDQQAADLEPLWQLLEQLKIPTLLVRGNAGFVSEENEQLFLSRVPNSLTVTLNAGHNVQEQQAKELAEAINGFTSNS